MYNALPPTCVLSCSCLPVDLSRRIEYCQTADDFYSTMGCLTQEMLEHNLINPTELMQVVDQSHIFDFLHKDIFLGLVNRLLSFSVSIRRFTPWQCFPSPSWLSSERNTPTTSLHSLHQSKPMEGLFCTQRFDSLFSFVLLKLPCRVKLVLQCHRCAYIFHKYCKRQRTMPTPSMLMVFSSHSGGLGSWESDDDADIDDEDSVVAALGCLGPLGGLLAPELQRYQKHLKGQCKLQHRIYMVNHGEQTRTVAKWFQTNRCPTPFILCRPQFESKYKQSLICFLQTNPYFLLLQQLEQT